MNKILKFSLFGVGGAVLFLGTYVGIALASGAPLHEIAGISMFVDAPETSEESEAQLALKELAMEERKREERTGNDLLQSNAGLLGAFMMESPFSASELRSLENELKMKLREQTIERGNLDVRSIKLDEWENSLRERQSELALRRTKLEDLESKIELRIAELEYAESVEAERQQRGWQKLAAAFKDSDPESAALMIADEDPADAALILMEMSPKQAGEILRAIRVPSEQKKYRDAYRAAAPKVE